MTYSVIISTEDIYSVSDPKIPHGYAKTGEFRPPRTGEFFLTSIDLSAAGATYNHRHGSPRLILRKLDEKEAFIQQTLIVLQSIQDSVKLPAQSVHVERLISKAQELLDV